MLALLRYCFALLLCSPLIAHFQVVGGAGDCATKGLGDPVLESGCELEGRLLDGAGKPLSGVSLVARGDRLRREDKTQGGEYFRVRRSPNVLPSGLEYSVTRTNGHGQFTFEGLAPGTYEIFREKPVVLLTRAPIQAPATGVVLRHEGRKIHIQSMLAMDPGPPIPAVDLIYGALWEIADWDALSRSDLEGEYWLPVKTRALRFWSLDGLPQPVGRNGSASLYVNAWRRIRIAILDPMRGVTFAEVSTGAGIAELTCMVPQGIPMKPGRLDFDLVIPPCKPSPWAIRTQVWHVESGAYLGRMLWALHERPGIELPAGNYRIRIDAILHQPVAGTFFGPGSDEDGFEREDPYWSMGGYQVDPEDHFLFVRPGFFSTVVQVEPGSSQVIEALLAAEGRLSIALESRLPADSTGPEPRVQLAVRRPGGTEWTPLLYLRKTWIAPEQGQNWIRAGMTRAADGQLAPGIWQVRAQCEDGRSAMGRVNIIAGQVTLQSMKW